ncbi:calcium-binding protein [Niveispirillum cyanobacteriorum]|uniref:Uncharacterized protein n=1 Tax=Niveispirillum cyanobacteriorum TaxID=1612173 RepID=A0A2K9NL15_9PROT|nr:calcium-binding protein [Niveispirillum cyanobacteriorum]AUN33075.1 hypothetical protein C0V82_21955 [Niveispirillum cyanobacteriorum]GGE45583.1 hypothetical protein GCM10011317_00100 [Niveispirillum cyanobacteriorum]
MAVNSGLVFNEAYYLATYTDVAGAIGKLQPDGVTLYTSGKQHFDAYGAAEGRVGSPLFDLAKYKQLYGDELDAAGLTSDAQKIAHWNMYGAAEGRDGFKAGVFDVAVYRALYGAELGDAGLTSDEQLRAHFVEYGYREGRQASASFDPATYLAANSDIAAAASSANGIFGLKGNAAALYHYYNYGIYEGRPGAASGPTFSISQSTNQVAEGGTITYTITSSIPLTAERTFTWTIAGDDVGGTVDKATSADFSAASAVVTFPVGVTKFEFTVSPSLDTASESLEGFKLNLLDSSLKLVGSQTAIITDNSANAPQSKTLTTGADSFTTGAGNDTFDATTANSLNTTDTVIGGAGTDSLTATITGGGTLRPTLSGIENITLTVSSAAATLNLADSTGYSRLASQSSSKSVTFDNVSSTGTTFALTSVTAEGLRANYTAGALAGTADVAAVTLDTVSNGSSDTSLTFSVNGTTTNTLETVSITTRGGASTLQSIVTTDVGTKTLNIAGDQNLTVASSLTAAINVVNASGLSGQLSITGANTTGMTITGGSANDVLTAVGGADSISGGAGNDNITGGAGANTLAGGTGDDTVTGGSGADVLSGEDGADVIVVSAAGGLTTEYISDTISGGAGADALRLTYAAGNTDTLDASDLVSSRITGIETLQFRLTGAGAATTVNVDVSDALFGITTDGTAALNTLNINSNDSTTGQSIKTKVAFVDTSST